MEERTVLDTQIKGITIKNAWQFVAGWTSIVFAVLFTYYSLKGDVHDIGLQQSKTDAIQDIRLDGMRRDIEIQNLRIKDLNERYNELQSKVNDKQ